MRTRSYTVGGANIKGNPSMKRPAVSNDVTKISRRVDLIIAQEFEWRWYWAVAQTLLGAKWRSFPSYAVGIARPVFGAQGIFWKRQYFKRVTSKVMPAFDFSIDHHGVMDDRWIRAVNLEDKLTRLCLWLVGMHGVVGADGKGDSAKRKNLMHQNLEVLDKMLEMLTRTDSPIAFEADMNIARGTWADEELMVLVHKYKGRVVGTHGVEYLIIFDAHCDTKVVEEKNYVLTPKEYGLNTDHEVRCLDFHLQRN